MELDLYHRQPDGTAYPKPVLVNQVARAELTIEADDGQQFRVILLDADDTFDLVVQYPNDEREIVWSLVRERSGA